MKRVPVFDEVRRYVAGIDLAGAADHYVCGPRKDDGSHDIEHFGTTTPELLRMLQWLKDRRVESVAMESTSVFWCPVWDILESGGLEVRLVDTREVRMVPGRKSDVKDMLAAIARKSGNPDPPTRPKKKQKTDYETHLFAMTFSIIIPVYNVAPYLRECLDSVLAQTYTDWEAIC